MVFAKMPGKPTFNATTDKPIPGRKGDKPPRQYYDLDGEYPIPPSKKGLKSLRKSAQK